jgi:membrane protein
MSVARSILMRMFGRPKGLLGKLGGILMARMNYECATWVIDLLHIQPNDKVVEVGFGPGVGIQLLARFLLMVSLVVSTVLTAFGNYLDSILPFGQVILTVLNVVVSLVLISFLFAAIYKVLPDRDLEWGDVVVGAIVTAVLFTIGKSLISWYIGSSAVASSFGAAGALIVLLLWVYYSAQIFLLGAEFTKVYANTHGSKQDAPVSEDAPLRST